jgi:hypothetical protein
MNARSTIAVGVLAFLIAGAGAFAVELAASGISMPFFNEAGKLTHKLIASRGTLVGSVQRLEQVEINYFSPTDPNVIVQKILADEATWDEKKEVLTGTRSITVATEETRLTGEGFEFVLATSRLRIHRNFRMENSEMILTSERAVAELLVAKSGDTVQVRDIKWCDAIGDLKIAIQPTATREYPFKTAFSDTAHYDGATKIVTLPTAIRSVDRKGQESRINKMEIKLGRKK